MSDLVPTEPIQVTNVRQVSVKPTIADQVQKYSLNGFKLGSYDIRVNQKSIENRNWVCIEGVYQVFTPHQARELAACLLAAANEAERRGVPVGN